MFVVHKHAARRLHYDLRLQFGDVLKSWTVTKGPSLDPTIRRLAVHVEEHPLEYTDFEAVIPQGQYGAGAMIVWDRGVWAPMGDPVEDFKRGTLKFRLAGERLKGGWTLVRIKSEAANNWLLIKEYDDYARPENEGDILDDAQDSVISGRTVEEMADSARAPKRRTRLRPGALPGAVRGDNGGYQAPQLATLSTSVPAGGDWLHEIKLDGYRTIARVQRGQATLFTRNGHDWTERYGDLAMVFEDLHCKRAVIDGEIVVQDAAGKSSFSALQEALASGSNERFVFYAFDLLHANDYDLTSVPLAARKEALGKLVEPHVGPTSPLQLSGHVVGSGADFYAQAQRMRLEGVVSKRLDAAYRSGRSKAWVKTKCTNTDEFVIVGYTMTKAAGGLAALLLAEADAERLKYVGKVGTGFSEAEASRLAKRLRAIERKTPAVRVGPGAAIASSTTWVKPVLMAEVEFATRTKEGALRHAVYRGLRPDKLHSEPIRPASSGRRKYVTDADLASVWVTNPDRVMFGRGGPTKLDLALYYAQVGDWMLPELLRRPISLVRCPSGKVEDCFFQRHAGPGMPDEIGRIRIREEGSQERGDYLYIADARGLLALAQFGVVEFHVWGCRVDKPERPDRMVFDLDPDESLPWSSVVQAAFEVREALTDLGLVPFVETTGSKGLHIVVPLRRKYAWRDVHEFSGAVARMLVRRAPSRFTDMAGKRHRHGRVFIDYHRNARTSTTAAAYSLRARPGAPASLPMQWSDLSAIDDPLDLNYATVPELASTGADPWADIDGVACSITSAMRRAVRDQSGAD